MIKKAIYFLLFFGVLLCVFQRSPLVAQTVLISDEIWSGNDVDAVEKEEIQRLLNNLIANYANFKDEQAHIEKIKVNLGTFKAFGLSDKALIADYNRIVMQFTLTSIAISSLFTTVYYLIQWSIGADFNLFHGSVIAALVLIVVGIRISLRTMIASRLRKTPGDLIYQR